MSTDTVIQYNSIDDVSNYHKTIVEAASGVPIFELRVDDVNRFLNWFEKDLTRPEFGTTDSN